MACVEQPSVPILFAVYSLGLYVDVPRLKATAEGQELPLSQMFDGAVTMHGWRLVV